MGSVVQMFTSVASSSHLLSSCTDAHFQCVAYLMNP
uniref:Uncharacterized protein n=1 Tax=Anguilla anguilla TaxID=7936 RepID=A0A0E9XIG9_ANGAN